MNLFYWILVLLGAAIVGGLIAVAGICLCMMASDHKVEVDSGPFCMYCGHSGYMHHGYPEAMQCVHAYCACRSYKEDPVHS